MSRKGHGPLKIEYRSTDTLKPYKNNPIKHPPEQVDALARMLKGPVGFTKPKRVGYGIELDPTFCDAIVRRWQDMTGKKATHAKEKKSFEAITEARGKS